MNLSHKLTAIISVVLAFLISGCEHSKDELIKNWGVKTFLEKERWDRDLDPHFKDGENQLEVSVTNLWINRLIGDEKLPPEQRKTSTNLVNDRDRFKKLSRPDADRYLRFSGLIGPVKIRFSRIYDIQK